LDVLHGTDAARGDHLDDRRMVLQFFVKRSIHSIQFAVFGNVRTEEAVKTKVQTTVYVINQFDWRGFHPAAVFDYFIQHIDGHHHLVGTFRLPANLLAEVFQKIRLGNGLGADNDPVKAQINQFLYLIDGTHAAAVLYFYVFRMFDDIHQVFLIAEIPPRSIEVNDVHEIRTWRVQLGQHLIQGRIIEGDLIIIPLT